MPAGHDGAGNAWLRDGDRRRRARLDLLSLVPLVAIITLVVLVAGVVWIVGHNEADRTRIKLATDALWVEQTLRFQLSINEDMLARLALEDASGTTDAVLDTRTRLHLAANPEILSVLWSDNQGRRIRSLPGGGAAGDPHLVARLAALGPRVTRPSYGEVGPDGLVTMGISLQGRDGILTATISLPLLLERHVPWWIAEQYGVIIMGANDHVLASRQRLKPDPLLPRHTISFDPPLHGTVLRITAYDPPARFHSTLLLAATGGLAIFAILALLVVFRNAARRREAEHKLRAETAFRRSMEESLTVGLRAKDHDGRILYVNAAFCNLVGWQPHELIGRDPPMPYWDPTQLGETEERHRRLAAGEAVGQSFVTRFCHRDGTRIDIQVYEAPLIDAEGRHRGWMGSIIDITETTRAARMARAQDEALARTGRLVTLGEMASTLAHELNQPLSAIASYAAGMHNLLEQGNADPAILSSANARLAHQADRAGQIIRHIQDLVKKRPPRFAQTRLDDLITETVAFLAADAREQRVYLEVQITPTPPLEADQILLEQVLINLLRNGMEAMADQRHGDIVRIRLLRDGDHAVIEVEDRGIGIDPELQGRLFDAFASTKTQGMGMGLKICRSIAELHGGHLSHRPADQGGTIFCLSLPLNRDDLTEAQWPG